MTVSKVWIEEGCIACRVCEDECAAVFEVGESNCSIKASADYGANEACIKKAAENCPVEVIKFS